MIAEIAREWRHTGWCAVRPAFASACSSPRTEDAVRELRALGCARVAVAPYVIAPGFLPDRIAAGRGRGGRPGRRAGPGAGGGAAAAAAVRRGPHAAAGGRGRLRRRSGVRGGVDPAPTPDHDALTRPRTDAPAPATTPTQARDALRRARRGAPSSFRGRAVADPVRSRRGPARTPARPQPPAPARRSRRTGGRCRRACRRRRGRSGPRRPRCGTPGRWPGDVPAVHRHLLDDHRGDLGGGHRGHAEVHLALPHGRVRPGRDRAVQLGGVRPRPSPGRR